MKKLDEIKKREVIKGRLRLKEKKEDLREKGDDFVQPKGDYKKEEINGMKKRENKKGRLREVEGDQNEKKKKELKEEVKFNQRQII